MICTILLFFSYMTFRPFSCQAWQSSLNSMSSMTFLPLSLSPSLSSFTMLGKNIPCETQISLSFRKWGVWYDRETKLMSMKQFFMFLSPLSQLMNLYVMFSCPCNIKSFITTNLNSYIAVNYVRAWRNDFYAETIKFQDSSWNFSFQAVQIPL